MKEWLDMIVFPHRILIGHNSREISWRLTWAGLWYHFQLESMGIFISFENSHFDIGYLDRGPMAFHHKSHFIFYTYIIMNRVCSIAYFLSRCDCNSFSVQNRNLSMCFYIHSFHYILFHLHCAYCPSHCCQTLPKTDFNSFAVLDFLQGRFIVSWGIGLILIRNFFNKKTSRHP